MTTSANSTGSTTGSMPAPPTNSGYSENDQASTENDQKPSEENSGLDEFGYEETKTEEEKPAEESKPAEEKPEEKVDPVTGYGEDDPKKEEKPAEGDEKKGEALKKEEVEAVLGELPEGYNKELASKYALENKLNKEQMEAYVKLAKEESEQFKIDQETQVKATRNQWRQELKNDSLFGGENFDKNVHRVEKLIDNSMPNLKKVLTDRGTVLPPYIMKDLLTLSGKMNPTTNLVTGDPGEIGSKETNFLEEMYV